MTLSSAALLLLPFTSRCSLYLLSVPISLPRYGLFHFPGNCVRGVSSRQYPPCPQQIFLSNPSAQISSKPLSAAIPTTGALLQGPAPIFKLYLALGRFMIAPLGPCILPRMGSKLELAMFLELACSSPTTRRFPASPIAFSFICHSSSSLILLTRVMDCFKCRRQPP